MTTLAPRLRVASAVSPALLALLLAPGCDKSGESAKPGERAQADAAPATEDAPQGPAMWVAKDADTTVYMLGTVHLLPAELEWRTPAIQAAFDEAKVVYFEADVASPEAQQSMMAALPRLGTFQDGRTLSAVLDAEQLAAVQGALDALGMPLAMVEPMKPWLVGITLESQAATKSGYAADSGVEMVLGKEAAAAGKQLRYFETAEQQLGIFAGLPEADQVAFLVQSSKAIVDDPDALDELVAAWSTGDVATLTALAEGDDGGMGSEAVTEALLVNRNRDWVGQLTTLMADEPGVFFVAVGAAHLAGDQGVPTLLGEAGIEVTGP